MLSIWHYVRDCHISRLRLDDMNLVFSIGFTLNCFLYNIFLGQHQPNIAPEIGKIWSFPYTVTQQDGKNYKFFERCLHWIMLPRDWRLIDGCDVQMFLWPLEQFIIMIRTKPRTLRVIFTDLSKHVKHFPKRIIKDDQKTINAVLFVSSLLSFESKLLQLPPITFRKCVHVINWFVIFFIWVYTHFILTSVHFSIFWILY